MTEDEAKTKWCPKAVVLESYAEKASFNVTIKDEQENFGRCIGSACMAWRWGIDTRSPAERCFDDTGLNTSEWRAKYRENPASAGCNDHAAFDRMYGKPEQPTHGYCGAFGKPESHS